MRSAEDSSAECPIAASGWETGISSVSRTTAYGLSVMCTDATVTFGCTCKDVTISGLAHQPASMGTYTWLPGVTHGAASTYSDQGRPVFYNAAADNLVFCRKPKKSHKEPVAAVAVVNSTVSASSASSAAHEMQGTGGQKTDPVEVGKV